MRKIMMCAIAAFLLTNAEAQTWKTPQASTTQTIKQNFALSTIELTYSRPGVKDRKIFGGLVPYNEIWRLGANNATEITFGDTVSINGTKIKPGTYGLLAIPNEKNWTLIISKQTNVTSAGAYKQDQDIVRYEAHTHELDDKVETFTMQFANVKDGSCDLHIMWDKTSVTLPITTNIDGAMMAQIDQVMSKDNRPFYNAAMYYINNGQDPNQALNWLNKAIEQDPKALRNHYQKANVLAKMGKKTEARVAATTGLELARAQKNESFIKQFETQLESNKK
jgi:tetratricopeptide (TPR) repeat protein